MKLSVLILSFNAPQILEKCIKSIYNSITNFEFEVLVHDNNSKDKPDLESFKRKFNNFQYFESNSNLFFTIPLNRMWKYAKGEYKLILNQDIEVDQITLQKLVDFLDYKVEYGAVGPKSIFYDGVIEKIPKRFYSRMSLILEYTLLGQIFRTFAKKKSSKQFYEYNFNQDFDCDVLQDSCILLRDKIFKIAPYNEKYKLYFTEDQLAIDVIRKGYKMRYLSQTFVRHRGSYSSLQVSKLKIRSIYFSDMIKYSSEYFGKVFSFLLILLLGISNIFYAIRYKFKNK